MAQGEYSYYWNTLFNTCINKLFQSKSQYLFLLVHILLKIIISIKIFFLLLSPLLLSRDSSCVPCWQKDTHCFSIIVTAYTILLGYKHYKEFKIDSSPLWTLKLKEIKAFKKWSDSVKRLKLSTNNCVWNGYSISVWMIYRKKATISNIPSIRTINVEKENDRLI